MALLDVANFLGRIFGEFSYTAPFVVLILCGVGLPLPEEVTLIGSGILLHRNEVEFLPIVAVCATAILIGDSIPYWLGRRYGMGALRVPGIRKILHPERFARLEQRFAAHGNWATFFCRFFAGVRIPGYFVAGTMRMPFPRFLVLDGLGILISVPLSIYLGKVFGDEVDKLQARVNDLHLIFAFVALSLALILVVRHWRLRRLAERTKTAAALVEEVGPAASGSESEPGRAAGPGESH